jgi:hypothetical protein
MPESMSEAVIDVPLGGELSLTSPRNHLPKVLPGPPF